MTRDQYLIIRGRLAAYRIRQAAFERGRARGLIERFGNADRALESFPKMGPALRGALLEADGRLDR